MRSPSCSPLETLPNWLTGTATIAVVMLLPAMAVVAKTPQEIARIAAPVTVQVNNNIDGVGSGVIIVKAGHTYTVLTANHVVKRPDLKYTISTNRGKVYPVSRIQRLQRGEEDPDLALVTFASRDEYPVAKLGDSAQAAVGSNIYVSGYPVLEWQKNVQREYEFSPGTITSRRQSAPQGYTLRYNADTVSGMSGSPIFNVSGKVIGIHGEGETAGSAQSSSGKTIPIKTGFNVGIPIDTFLSMKTQRSAGGGSGYALPQAQSSPVGSEARANNIPHTTRPISINPNDASAYYNRANARYERGDKQGAIRDYLQAIHLRPKFALAYNNLGKARYDQGETQAAIRDYLQAIRFSRRFALAYNNLGLARYKLGETRQAIRDYTQAIQFLPTYATAYFNRGVAQYHLGNKQGAIRDYTQAIRLSRDYTLAYYKRGAVRRELGEKQAALEDFRHAANIYRQEGNTEEYKYVLAKIRELQSEAAYHFR
ncbi:MAG: serine protease [Chroococcidiopsidaceae cyanobacterium CP_BM_ER_R8_30]|nr:serine protease [Chroococcidiopsidaceae cyanobacterium CP_BM_ER_R8_30]